MMTPGPWRAERAGNTFNVYAGDDYLQRIFVAFTAVLPVGAEGDAEANAKAIASLPELVRALATIRTWRNDHGLSAVDDIPNREWELVEGVAKAALGKAGLL